MRQFYIETDQLFSIDKILRYFYEEDDAGNVTIIKVVDPKSGEETLISEIKRNMNQSQLVNLQTAHLGNYPRHYI